MTIFHFSAFRKYKELEKQTNDERFYLEWNYGKEENESMRTQLSS